MEWKNLPKASFVSIAQKESFRFESQLPQKLWKSLHCSKQIDKFSLEHLYVSTSTLFLLGYIWAPTYQSGYFQNSFCDHRYSIKPTKNRWKELNEVSNSVLSNKVESARATWSGLLWLPRMRWSLTCCRSSVPNSEFRSTRLESGRPQMYLNFCLKLFSIITQLTNGHVQQLSLLMNSSKTVTRNAG